jgi:hypothetical protein
MSMARVVITAVVVEGRSKSEVARDYGGVAAVGADSGGPVSGRGGGGLRTALAEAAPQSAPDE